MAKKLPKFGVNNYHKRYPKSVQVGTQKITQNEHPIVKPIVQGQGRIILMFEKVTIITLLYLTTLGDIKWNHFEVVSGDSVSLGIHTM